MLHLGFTKGHPKIQCLNVFKHFLDFSLQSVGPTCGSLGVSTVETGSLQDVAWWRDGLRYASLGSGHLLWDCALAR